MSNLITPAQIKILIQAGIIPPGTPEPIIKIFGQMCEAHKLNPAKKEIFLLPYNVKVNDKWEVRYATIVGRDGLRIKAQRTGQLAGIDQPIYDDNKTIAMFKEKELPKSCTVTVYRFVNNQKCAFTASVAFAEFSSGKQKWLSMPFHMIAKVAECHALKMGFGEELQGLNVEEEMAAFQEVQEVIETEDIKEIETRLSEINDIEALKEFYNSISQKNTIEPEVRNLFSNRRKQIEHAIAEFNA